MARLIKAWSEAEKQFFTDTLTLNDAGVIIYKIDTSRGKAGSPLRFNIFKPDHDAKAPKSYARVLFTINGKRKVYYIHHLVFFLRNGRQATRFIDHYPDPDPLNNHPSNLRDVTIQQNNQNRARQVTVKGRKPSSCFKGVTVSRGYVRALIKWPGDNRNLFLGHHGSEVDAAKAYDLASIVLHGEYGRRNFPDSNYTSEQIASMKSFIQSKGRACNV